MKKSILIILSVFMLAQFAGCAKRPGGTGTDPAQGTPYAAVTAEADGTAQAAEPTPGYTAEPTPGYTAEPTPGYTPEPTPVQDPEAAEALELALRHGLSAEELRGEYGLFIRFAETVEGNASLGKYAEFVYLIFPVIADQTEYLDEAHFLERLSQLSFAEQELDPGVAGQYRFEPNEILIDPRHSEGVNGDCELPAVVFHELMHFADRSLNGEERTEYILDGESLTPEEYLALPLDDRIRAVIVYGADLLLEGGAELYTAKYFAGAVRWYFKAAAILTGIEYIYGTEKLDELFFSAQSDTLLAQLLLDAGYTEDEYYDVIGNLNWYTNQAENVRPAREICAEDILIDLYEHEYGSGWQADEYFLYVLKAINGVAWSGYEASEHADFLKEAEFGTYRQYEEFLGKVYADLPERPDVSCEPLAPVIRGRHFTLASFARWTDAGSGQRKRGTIAAEYDFNAESTIGCRLIDMDAVMDRYFG